MVWYIQYTVPAVCNIFLKILNKHAPLKEKSKSKQFLNKADLNITYNWQQNFWQTLKPFFPDKLKHKVIINLSENKNILQNSKLITIMFNN